jgi:hypothetical protein
VSLSLSIFQKPCPGCAASVSVSVARCDCGHIFESASDSLSPLETSLRDEELYEGYLTARAEQAHQAAYVAEQALAEEADNPELASAAALAHEVARSIDDDLAEQRKKIAAIKKALHKDEPVKAIPVATAIIQESPVVAEQPATAQAQAQPTVPEQPAPIAPAAMVKQTAAVIAETPAPARVSKKTSAPTHPTPVAKATSVSTSAAKPSTVASKPVKPSSRPTWQATTAQKAAGVLAAIKNAKVRESLARAKNAVVAATNVEQKAVSHTPKPQPALNTSTVPSAAPPSAFRKEQASRAEKIMETHKTVDSKDCPNCTSSVPINTTRCQCGFTFVTGGNDLPSLTLCTGDFTALRNSLKLNLR